MKKIINNIYALIFALSILLILINFVIHLFLPASAPNINMLTVLIFFVLTSFVVYLVGRTTKAKTPASVINVFMIASVVKMSVLFIYIIVLMFSKRADFKTILIYLLIYFVLYLILEVAVLLKKIKQ